jgi:hypothetical protein
LGKLNFVEVRIPVAEDSRLKKQELQDRDSETLHTWHKEKDDFSSISHKKELQRFLAEKMRMTEIKFKSQTNEDQDGYLRDYDDYYQTVVLPQCWSQIKLLDETLQKIGLYDKNSHLQMYQKER